MNHDTFFRLIYLVGEFHATSRICGCSGSQCVTEQRFKPLELFTTRIELRAELDFGHFRTAVGVASLVIEPGIFG